MGTVMGKRERVKEGDICVAMRHCGEIHCIVVM
jgi:hypothetical protein